MHIDRQPRVFGGLQPFLSRWARAKSRQRRFLSVSRKGGAKVLCYNVFKPASTTSFAMHQTGLNDQSLTSTTAAPAHAFGDHPDVLRRIHDPATNLCLWQRAPCRAISHELSPLQVRQLPDVRCRTSPESFDDDVSTLLRQQGLEPSAFEHWRTDLRRLADMFFSVSKAREVTLRLEATATDGCRRFHIDQTHLRLLCTYRGPGTEWLPDAQVDRVAQANGATNDGIIRHGEPSRFGPFWVGIMKGNTYPGNAGHGLVHRSPPIAGSGQTRVLFCLDY